ncbi:MAG: acetate--CoA ligase family protein [Moorellaceae bacterium]
MGWRECRGAAAHEVYEGDKVKELILQGQAVAEHQVKALLASYGVEVPSGLVLPPGIEEAPPLPFSYPVVLKVSAPDVLHKTEVGGVRLNIRSREELQLAVEEMRARFPGKSLLIEKQQPPGLETIVGLINDATFGPSLMVGLGGIFTELYEDVSFRVLPIQETDAYEMFSELRAARIFQGFRGIRADLNALVRLLMNVSRLGIDLGQQIEQMDLNPVIVYADKAVVVDAKLRIRQANG